MFLKLRNCRLKKISEFWMMFLGLVGLLKLFMPLELPQVLVLA